MSQPQRCDFGGLKPLGMGFEHHTRGFESAALGLERREGVPVTIFTATQLLELIFSGTYTANFL